MAHPALLLTNIKGLVQVRESGNQPLRGKEMAELPVLENAWLLAENGRIKDFGAMAICPSFTGEKIDCSGRFVFPSYVDSHTHLVFAGSRENEFILRIKGATYEEIARAGGGILNSAQRMQDAGEVY